jgi:hypothetical protein
MSLTVVPRAVCPRKGTVHFTARFLDHPLQLCRAPNQLPVILEQFLLSQFVRGTKAPRPPRSGQGIEIFLEVCGLRIFRDERCYSVMSFWSAAPHGSSFVVTPTSAPASRRPIPSAIRKFLANSGQIVATRLCPRTDRAKTKARVPTILGSTLLSQSRKKGHGVLFLWAAGLGFSRGSWKWALRPPGPSFDTAGRICAKKQRVTVSKPKAPGSRACSTL